MRVPIKAVREFGKKFGMSHVIIFAKEKDGKKRSWVSTWGLTTVQCGEAADFGNWLKDSLGWPASLHAQPSRVKRLRKENAAFHALAQQFLAIWRGMKRTSLGPKVIAALDHAADLLGVDRIGHENDKLKVLTFGDVVLALELVSMEVPVEKVKGWTEDQMKAAFEWAWKLHLQASDNIVRVPPMPEFLKVFEKGESHA